LDRSLWLLLRLRFVGWVRRWVRNLRSPRRALLALIALLCFLPGPIFALFAPRVQVAEQVALIRRFGPLGLFLFCLINVLLASEDRTITYSPAEVNFLFPGPYRPRQLLLYKIVGTLLAAVFTALFFTLLCAHHSYSFISAFFGVLFSVFFLYLFVLAVGLFISATGALAFNRQRRVVLGAVLVLISLGLGQAGRQAARLDGWELLLRLERSAAVQAAVIPFQPFIRAFTAERVWPDLVGWSSLSAAIDAALLGLILVLNAQYLEASATASARRYERLQRARRGGGISHQALGRWRFPELPSWGGIGPNLWRQTTTALRSPSRVVTVWLLFLFPVILSLLSGNPKTTGLSPSLGPMSFIATFTIIGSAMIGFDFRSDLDRMEGLKTLPIPPSRLVFSQMLVPAAVMTIGQWLALGLLAWFVPTERPALLAVAFVLPLFNLLVIEVENLYFLWYPVRLTSGQSVDFQAMGRQFLVTLAKMATVGLVAGVAAGFGGLVFFLIESWPATLGVVWVVVAGFIAGFVPLVAMAFKQFDVARDTPA
jgi:hypothetical protein